MSFQLSAPRPVISLALTGLLFAGCDVPADKCTQKTEDGSYSIILGCGEDTGTIVNDSHTGTDDSAPDTDSQPDDTADSADSDSDTAPLTDADGDGYIAQSDGGDDCDDGDANIHPDASESCNGVDDDCDGSVDEGVMETYHADSDGDGYGDPDASVEDCDVPPGYVQDATDCDDSDATIHPYALESCTDAVDLNCDGSAGTSDLDGDGTIACEDCDDADASAYPGNAEVCDGVDNDCEGSVDVDAVDAYTWYLDADSDTYGDPDVSDLACAIPSGYSANPSDCNDSDASVNPSAAEVCNGVDDDCDLLTDEDSVFDSWYADTDGDGYGDPDEEVSTCDGAPAGYVSKNDDCDDGDASVNPGMSEYCNGFDDDCDGEQDENSALDVGSWYADVDGDGYGEVTSLQMSCEAPPNYIPDATDCDDGDASVNPGATEVCNGIDDDCDALADDDDSPVAETAVWYADRDGDSWGDATDFVAACNASSPYTTTDGTDCDDGDAAAYPGATEIVADGIDQDCDGSDLTNPDVDSDGYDDVAAGGDDCDDGDASVNPGATEVCNGADDDCDGSTDEGVTITYYLDADADGYGTSATSTAACAQPASYVTTSTDCDDGDSGVNPGEAEVCDGVDNDCSGGADDGLAWTSSNRDGDGDGYGDPSVSTATCDGTAPAGYVFDTTDCDDGDSGVNPGEVEIVGNGVDDDCSGTETVFTTDFGIASGSCTTDGFVLSDGTSVRQAGGCYLWVEGGGSLAAPVVSDDVPIPGLTAGETYTFSWNVGNAFAPSTQFVGAVDGGSIDSVSVTTGASSTLAVDVTVAGASVTASIWHTGTGAFDGYITGFTVEH